MLVKENKYQDALSLALSFYEGKAKAVVGLGGSSKTRKNAVAQLVRGIITITCPCNIHRFFSEAKIENVSKNVSKNI